MALPNQNQSIKNSNRTANTTPENFKNAQNSAVNQGGLNEVKSNQYNTKSNISEKDFDEDDDALMDYDEDAQTLRTEKSSSIEGDEADLDSDESWNEQDNIGNRKQSPEQVNLKGSNSRAKH